MDSRHSKQPMYLTSASSGFPKVVHSTIGLPQYYGIRKYARTITTYNTRQSIKKAGGKGIICAQKQELST